MLLISYMSFKALKITYRLITFLNLNKEMKLIGYEPADLTVHPPPPELPRVGSFFLYRCLVFSKKNVLKGKPEYFGDI